MGRREGARCRGSSHRGLSIGADEGRALLHVDEEAVRAELPQVREHLEQFGDRLPDAIRGQLEALEQRLGG